MALNKQTANFPPIHAPEQSWEQSLRALENVRGHQGIVNGLKMSIPSPSGLMPEIENGNLLMGDRVYGIHGSLLAEPAIASSSKLFIFDLAGARYEDDQPVGSVKIAEVAADATAIAAIGQNINYGGFRYGIKGEIDLAHCVKAADTPLVTFTKPSGMTNIRVSHGEVTLIDAVTGGGAGDLARLVCEGDTVASHDINAAATLGAATVSDTSLVYRGEESLLFSYHAIDGNADLTGRVRFSAEITVY
jgi:hypothetical protein